MIIIDVDQTSDDWNRLRAGLPTASNFSKLITSDGKQSKQLNEYAAGLAADATAGKPLDAWEGNKWTERGHEMEDFARSWYALESGNDVTQVGFVMTDDGRYGCSPDGLTGTGCIEIKCLSKTRHTLAIAYCQKHGRIPPEYVAQVQGEMMICEREWNDFVLWHPELPSIIVRQYPDDGLHSALRSAIDVVIEKRNEYMEILENAKR